MVLQIILTVLAIFGIILLCILALLLLFLICPIRYKADISYHYNKPAVKGVITYFFHILRIYAEYPSDRICVIKVLFFTLGSDKKENKSSKRKDEKGAVAAKETTETVETAPEAAKEETTENEESPVSESAENTASEEAETAKDKELLPERLQLTLEKICGKIEGTIRAVEKTEDFLYLPSTQNFLKVSKKAGIRMFRSMKPHISGKAEIGFEDPSVTGMIYAVYGVLSPYRSGNFTLDAYFEEEVPPEADVKIRGRIILGVILVQTLRILIFGHALKVKKNLNVVQKAWRKNGNE